MVAPMEKMRIGIVGLGMAVTPHARSFLDLADRVEVAYAFSPTERRRAAFAADFPFPLAASLDLILDDPSVAAVVVLTPPNTHLDITRRCAAAGKHVLLEKPLEITPGRAAAVVETCRRAGVRLGVVLQHRYRPAALKLKGILAAGGLGRLAGASASMPLWRPQSYYDEPGRGERERDGGGVLLTQAIHTLDLYVDLAGLPAEVTAYAATSLVHRMETEDMVGAGVRFANGAIGAIAATTAAFPGFPERIELIGEKGTAVIDGHELRVCWRDGRTDGVAAASMGGGKVGDPPVGDPPVGDPMAFPHDHHRALIADFIDAIGEGREPPVTGADALGVHRLIDALLASAAEGRPVAVEAP